MPIDSSFGKNNLPEGERQISAKTWFYKFISPVLILGFLLVWACGILAAATPGGPVAIVLVGCFDLFLLACTTYDVIRHNVPLKEIWICPKGILVSNLKEMITVPYEAIRDVSQRKAHGVARIAVVVLSEETTFGQRFTFMPRDAMRFSWPSPIIDDVVVVELRERVLAAHRTMVATKSQPGRSVMADDELDGPF